MASIKDLYTKESCEKPERLHVGDEWVDVLGYDAEVVQRAEIDANRGVATGIMTKEEALGHIMAAIIVDWSFEEECNADNVKELCVNSPSFRKAIDRKAGERANFTAALKSASSDTPKQQGGSGSKKKAQKG